MEVDRLTKVRKQAEAAVSDMPDGALKVKAFEVILGHLIGDPSTSAERASVGGAVKSASASESKRAKTKPSIPGRILVLKDEGFFNKQRTLPEVQEALATNGWHYTQRNLSGPLLGLARKGDLRRVPFKDGKKKIYKYSNP